MEKQQYVCEKCGNMHYVSDQFQATGGNFAKIFDVQNKKFITISCTQCGYTELYRSQTSGGMNVLDFLLGGGQSKTNASLHSFFCVNRRQGKRRNYLLRLFSLVFLGKSLIKESYYFILKVFGALWQMISNPIATYTMLRMDTQMTQKKPVNLTYVFI